MKVKSSTTKTFEFTKDEIESILKDYLIANEMVDLDNIKFITMKFNHNLNYDSDGNPYSADFTGVVATETTES